MPYQQPYNPYVESALDMSRDMKKPRSKFFAPGPDISNFTRIIPRSEWGAVPAKWEEQLINPTPYVMFHLTGSDPCTSQEDCSLKLRNMQKDHMAKGMPDIQFNFLVGGDLNIYECRGWHVQPTVPEEKYQKKKGQILEIGFFGWAETSFPTQAMMDVYGALVEYGFKFKYLDKAYFRQPRDGKDYSTVNIVTRQAWGAREPLYEKPLPHPILHTLFSYANIKPCTSRKECMQAMRDLQNKNMDKDDMSDIQYNFYMAPDLTLYEGRGWHVSSEETYKYYKSFDGEKFDICYLGHVKDLVGDEVLPSPEAERARETLLDYGVSQGYLDVDANALCLHQ